MRQQTESKQSCVQSTLKIMGDKWTGLLLLELSKGPATFSELEVTTTGISPRTLSQRLDKLEHEDIISKHKYCEHPPRYRYQITKKGKELQSVIRKMIDWGSKYS